MPPLKPIKRRDLIYHLKQLGFDGRYSGKRHQFMLKDSLRITIPILIKVRSVRTF